MSTRRWTQKIWAKAVELGHIEPEQVTAQSQKRRLVSQFQSDVNDFALGVMDRTVPSRELKVLLGKVFLSLTILAAAEQLDPEQEAEFVVVEYTSIRKPLVTEPAPTPAELNAIPGFTAWDTPLPQTRGELLPPEQTLQRRPS